ncbi:MAG: hypothetical protein KAS32_25445 [Candidatus Peribacteraceae bacterium]|nr:hypothetical protein [Candidatus Peribacteraceae bacterium]
MNSMYFPSKYLEKGKEVLSDIYSFGGSIEVGDIITYKVSGLYGKALDFLSGNGDNEANHIAVCVGKDKNGEPLIGQCTHYGGLPNKFPQLKGKFTYGTVETKPFSENIKASRGVSVLRLKNIGTNEKKYLTDFFHKNMGTKGKYDFKNTFRHYSNKIFGTDKEIKPRKGKFNCATVVREAFPEKPIFTTPKNRMSMPHELDKEAVEEIYSSDW